MNAPVYRTCSRQEPVSATCSEYARRFPQAKGLFLLQARKVRGDLCGFSDRSPLHVRVRPAVLAAERAQLSSRFGGTRCAQLPQALPSLHGFVGFGITLDQVAELLYSVIFLAHLDQRKPFLQLGRSGFAAARKVLQD